MNAKSSCSEFSRIDFIVLALPKCPRLADSSVSKSIFTCSDQWVTMKVFSRLSHGLDGLNPCLAISVNRIGGQRIVYLEIRVFRCSRVIAIQNDLSGSKNLFFSFIVNLISGVLGARIGGTIGFCLFLNGFIHALHIREVSPVCHQIEFALST